MLMIRVMRLGSKIQVDLKCFFAIAFAAKADLADLRSKWFHMFARLFEAAAEYPGTKYDSFSLVAARVLLHLLV